jgi:hypothetical protein
MILKRTIPFILAAMLGVWPAMAQNESSPLSFAHSEWSFGTIEEKEGAVTHRFTFTNTGDVPIAIDRVNSSCGCTTPDYSRALVQPGKEGTVIVSFDPTGYAGEFSKSVVVVTGGGRWRNILIVKGTVTPREKTPQEAYPFDLGGGLRVDNTTLAFRQVAQGKSSSMPVSYINTSEKTISIDIVPAENSGVLAVNAPETICAGCKGNITLTYDLSGKDGYYGMIHDLLKVSVDGTLSEQTMYTSMIGVDDFSTQSIEAAPRMTLSAQYHNFGDVRSRNMPFVFRVTLRNDGSETLHIRWVSEKVGLKATIKGRMTVAPKASLPFELLLYSNKYPSGQLSESIIITSDDPLRPVRELRITAKVK